MRKERRHRQLALGLTALLLLGSFLSVFVAPSEVFAAPGDPIAVPADAGTVTSSKGATVGSSLWNAVGPVEVVVQLTDTPLAVFNGDRTAQTTKINAAQNAVAAAMAKYGATELARLNTALNAIVYRVDAANIPAISKEAGLKSINKLGSYELADPVVTSYVGGTALQTSQNLKGQGMVVAVMDSGADYTHANLGGPGTVAFYNQCYAQRDVAPTGDCAKYFGPNAPKVIGGYDFVGESWPNTPEKFDPNPIDAEGHGTHVADIIAGKTGMAPEAKVVAVKVCSAVATSCSGIALLAGADYVAKWNMNAANASRKISVVNLSLGSSYGQDADDLTNALNNLYQMGIVVVASAGNSADRPFIVGSPSIGFGVISVAQTSMPNEYLYPIKINAPTAGVIRYTVYQEWSAPFEKAITGDIAYVGRGCPAGSVAGQPGDDPYLTSPAGKVALIDRGACSVSLKAARASAAGALAVIIANNVPGAPPSFSYGGGTVTVPVFVISQADGLKLRTAGTNVTLDPANKVSLAGTMVSTSSRGPTIGNGYIKPDIGAPGASLSAEVGTGNEQTVFGGTSGAAPVVSGAAILLKQKYPNFSPSEIKSLLMTNADTNNQTLDLTGKLYATPISRIGGGELRVDRAANSGLLAQVKETGVYNNNGKLVNVSYTTGSLSFGFQAIPGNSTKVLSKTVNVKNLTNQGRLYTVELGFRDPADKATNAVTLLGPTQFWLNGGQSQDIQIQLMITGPNLPAWPFTGTAGSLGGDGTQLNAPEFDGYIKLNGGTNNSATLAWQVLPHKSADTRVLGKFDTWNNGPVKALQLANDNGGNVVGQVDVFQLLGTSPQLTTPLPNPGDNKAIVDLKYFGVREVGNNLQFAINTYGQRTSPNYPAEFDVYVDANDDGKPDYVVYNTELGGSFAADGRNAVYVANLATGKASAYFLTDTDFNSGNLIMTVPMSALNVKSGTKIGAQVLAFDNYFTGALTDAITGSAPGGFATYTIGAPRFTLSNLPWTNAGTLTDGGLTILVPVNGTQVQMNVSGTPAISTATGFLLMYRDAQPTREAEVVIP